MELHPKKRFGQHFLRDSGILDRIVRLVQPTPSDLFVEVGAGTGALTERVARLGPRLYAVEVDSDVVHSLQKTVSPYPAVTVVTQDVLELDMRTLLSPELPARTPRAIGNLPYNIATAIIEKFLGLEISFRDLTFMTQLEVAERIVAPPGSKTYGYLSVFCQHSADVRLAFKVSPGAFVPPPKVMSAVVVFRPKDSAFDARLERYFSDIAKAAFAHRRKKLANSLRQCPKIGLRSDALLRHAGVDGSLRAEQLSLPEYEQLARAYSELF